MGYSNYSVTGPKEMKIQELLDKEFSENTQKHINNIIKAMKNTMKNLTKREKTESNRKFEVKGFNN